MLIAMHLFYGDAPVEMRSLCAFRGITFEQYHVGAFRKLLLV